MASSSLKGTRLKGTGMDALVNLAARRVGLHDPHSKKLEDRFTPHCCRHWFTTYLLRADMKREYVQWLRGDAIKEAVDIYFHINPADVKESYLEHIPQLGI
jgi:integrase/recombinase XerD